MKSGVALAFAGIAACGTDPPSGPELAECQPPIGTWQNADGRVNGDILTLVVLPDGTVLAGTSFGVMTLDPTTKAWTGRVEFTAPVTSLAVDPADPERVLAVADGIHQSSDGGASWGLVLAGGGTGAVAFAPSPPSTVVAVVGGLTFTSSDGGRVWSPGSAQDLGEVLDLVIWAGDADRLLTRRAGAIPMLSVDGGASWQVDPSSGGFNDLISAGPTFYTTDNMIVRRSDDGWQTWSALPFTSQFVPYTLAVDPANRDALFVASAGRIHASGDGGQTWNEWFEYPPIGWPAAMAVGPDGALHVAASRGSAVVELSNGGDEVHWYGGGISGSGRALADPVNGLLYAASSDGVFVSAHAGITWATIATELPIAEPALFPTTMATAPSDPAVLYVRYSHAQSPSLAMVARSDDAGQSWIEVGYGDPLPAVVDPTDPHTVYNVVDRRLWSSTDGADTWTPIALASGYVTGVWADRAGESSILIATEDGGRVLLIRATERGTSGTVIFEEGEDLAAAQPLGRILDVHVTSGYEILLATLSGTLIRADRDGTWIVLDPVIDADANLGELTAHPSNRRAVFAIAGGVVFRSDDLGASWCRQDDTLSEVTELAALGGTPPALVASDGDRLYRIGVAP